MNLNVDYLTDKDIEKIYQFVRKENIFLYQLGQMCGIQDKGFWSRIMSGKKPIPEHARRTFNSLMLEKGI